MHLEPGAYRLAGFALAPLAPNKAHMLLNSPVNIEPVPITLLHVTGSAQAFAVVAFVWVAARCLHSSPLSLSYYYYL